MASRGHAFTQWELSDMELAYIGGLLGLDWQVDFEARDRAFTELANKRGPSPNRRG